MRDAGDHLHVVSHFPGRLRVRARLFREEPSAAEATARRLRDVPGVTAVTATTLTGSILILYDARAVDADALVAAALAESKLPAVKPDTEEHALGTGAATRVWNAVRGADESLFRAAGGKVDLKTAVPGMLVAGGLLKLALSPFAPPQWYDLVFWSYVTFNNLHLSPAPRPRGRSADSDGR